MPDTVLMMVEMQTTDTLKNQDLLVEQACFCSTFNSAFLSLDLNEIARNCLRSLIYHFMFQNIFACTTVLLLYFLISHITVIKKNYAKILLMF